MKFEYNDGGRSKYFTATSVGDCGPRALAIATGLDYKEVYNKIKSLQGKTPRNGTKTKAFKRFIEEEMGWTWVPKMSIGSGCTTHMRSVELPVGTVIVRLSRHYSVVIDGVINDTYDPSRNGRRCVYGYWIKK